MQSITKQREFPLWEPRIACGAPLFAESEAGVLYPTLLFFLTGNVTLAANLTVLSALLIAMLGSYTWSRCLGLSPLASGIAALAYGLGETFLLRTAGLNIIHVIAWLPFSLAVIHLGAVTAQKRYWFLLIAIWTAQLLAGHFQMVAICQICCWMYIIGLVCTNTVKSGHSRWKMLGLAVAALLLSALLAAVQLLPTQEFAKQSTRGGAIPLDWLAERSPTWKMLTIFVNPFYPAWNKDPDLTVLPHKMVFFARDCFQYMGLLPLLLCLSSLAPKRRRLALCLWALAIFFLIAALGPRYGIYYLLWRYFPHMNSFRMPGRFAIPMVCLLAALAAIGAQNLSDWISKRRGQRAAQWTLAGILLLTCLDLGYVNSQVQGYLSPLWSTPPPSLQAVKSRQRVYSPYSSIAWNNYLQLAYSNDEKRGDAFWCHRSLLSPGTSLLWDVEAPDDYVFYGTGIVLYHSSAMQTAISHLMEELYRLDAQEVSVIAPKICDWLRLLGISHIVTPLPLPCGFPEELFSEVQTAPIPEIPDTQIYIFTLANPLAKVRLVPAVTDRLPSDTLNLERFLGLEEQQSLYESDLACPTSIGQAQIERATNNSISIATSCDRNAFLVISNTYDPNWRAFIDGHPAALQRVNLSMQGLAVPTGQHRVELKYASPAFALGWRISLAALVGVIGLAVFSALCGVRPQHTEFS
ncbi:YfhO family protein [bacterium]|nr:YfhO family protein [bacterium]